MWKQTQREQMARRKGRVEAQVFHFPSRTLTTLPYPSQAPKHQGESGLDQPLQYDVHVQTVEWEKDRVQDEINHEKGNSILEDFCDKLNGEAEQTYLKQLGENYKTIHN